MKDNRDNKAIIIPVNDMRETLQDFTDEEVGAIIRTLFNGGEPDFKDRAMRIVYRQLRAANERINATYEAKRERYKKAAEARWQKDGDGQQESTQEEAEIEPEETENTDEKGENATHETQSDVMQRNTTHSDVMQRNTTHSDVMQRNTTHSDALKCNAIPNQTIPNQTKPKKESDREKTAASCGTHTPDFSEGKQDGRSSGGVRRDAPPGNAAQPPDETDWRKYWNDRAGDSDIPHIGMTQQRRERIKQLANQYGADNIRAVIDYVTTNRRLSRRNGKSNFRATFDWVTGKAFQQLLEEAMQDRRERQRQEQETEEELRRNPPPPKPKSRRENLAECIEAVRNGNSKSPSIIAILRAAKASGDLQQLGLEWDG